MLQQTLAGPSLTAESALRIVDVLACVRVLAETASVLPLKTYRRIGEEREPATGRLAELLERPAPATTQANLIAQLVGSLALRGNAFLGKFRNGEGEIEQLALLPPDRVTVQLVGGEPIYTLTSDQGRQTTHTASDVLHLKGLSFDGVTGLSPIAQAREALGLAAALEQYASGIYGNSATPLGVLSVPGSHGAQDDLMENLREAWESRHGSPERAGRVAVLSGDIQFHPISLSPSDSEFIASRRLSTQEVCRLFRVPPHLVAAQSENSLTYSTVEMDALNFVRFSLQPWLTVIEQAITADPDLSPRPVFAEFILDGFLRAASETRAAIYSQALHRETGWLTREEVRRLENLPPEPESKPEAGFGSLPYSAAKAALTANGNGGRDG